MSLIGARVERREDPRLLTGRGRYVGDVVRPHMVSAAVLRSPHAHARIRRIDTRQARALPGVLDCVTTTTFMDYLLPGPADVPPIEVVLVEDTRVVSSPLGVRGVGEVGTSGAGAALANAVADALGVEVTRLPLTPERILGLLDGAGG